ncbi:MAG: LacI family DNA-binding transcriptional regulator [Clostridia bacterium]|nr:LacI family DNA-binding transcriptional regulator [Clostridia bacterium]
MGSRPTIQMVAERAGVSRGTVDRVINGRAYVSEAVRRRVLDAMRELRYMPVHMTQAAALGMLPQGEPCTLGVLMPNWGGYFQREIEAGIEQAQQRLRDYGVRVLVEHCETELPEECVEKLDALRAKGAAGIALCAKNHVFIAERVDTLTREGIPIVTFNSDLPHSARVCFIGQDVVGSGRVAGELMAKCVPQGARVLAAVGNLEFDGHKKRLDGFMERMTECGFDARGIEVIQTHNDYTLSCRRVGEALVRTPDLAGVYMANHSVTGCAEAVRAVGRRGSIRVISHDVTDGTRRLLAEGAVDFAIAQDLRYQGRRPLELLFGKLCKNESPREEIERLSLQIVCSQNL